MKAQQDVDGPPLRQDAGVSDEEPIVVDANLHGRTRCVVLVGHRVHHRLTHDGLGKRVALNAVCPVVGYLRLEVLPVEQGEHLIGLLDGRAFDHVLVDDLRPLEEANLDRAVGGERLGRPRKEQGGRIRQVAWSPRRACSRTLGS